MRIHFLSAAPGERVFVRFTYLSMAALAVIGMIGFAFYKMEINAEKKKLAVEESYHVEILRSVITGELKHILQDLLFLEGQANRNGISNGLKWKSTLEQSFLHFLNSTKMYDQIRLLDKKGKEIVRVNYHDGQPRLVAEKYLQWKGNRAYFKQASHLRPMQVFVSPLDLNMEHGKIEIPLKPILRLCMPVFDSRHQMLGVLVLNYLGANMLERFKEITQNFRNGAMLLNREGYWLASPDTGNEWGFMFPDRKPRSFANNFPEAWSRIADNASGQFTIKGNLYTFTTVHPLEHLTPSSDIQIRTVGKGYYWKIITNIPGSRAWASVKQTVAWFFLPEAFLLVFLVIVSWFLALALERKRLAVEHARKSEIRYRMVHETSFDAMIITNAENRIIDANPSAEKMFAYDSGELKGMDMIQLIPGRVRKVHRAAMRSLLENDNSSVPGKAIESEGRKKHGDIFPIEIALNKFRQDNVVWLTATVRDITVHKLTENILNQQAAFVRYNPAPVLQLNRGGVVLHANPAAEFVFNGNMAGKDIGQIFSGMKKENLDRMNPGKTIQFEQEIGEQLFLFTLRKDMRTQSCYIYGSDITKRKQAEEKTSQLLKEVRRLVRRILNTQEEERKNLAQALHDDMGQLLTATQTNAAAIMRSCEQGDIDKAYACAEESRAILSQLKRMTRMHLVHLRPAALDSLGLKASIKAMADAWSRREGAICIVTIDDGLDSLTGTMNIHIYRIVQEALTNIARYAHASKISVQLRGRNNELYLSIQDDGVGVDLSQPRYGLGLIGMSERAEALNGHISFRSKPGEGMYIEARFPCRTGEVK